MKNKIKKAFGLFLASLFFIQNTYAADPNIDGGGGGLGQGTNDNGWVVTTVDGGRIYEPEGLRVYVVNSSTGAPASNIIDITNSNVAEINIRNFGKKTKYEYKHVDGTLRVVPSYTKVKINTSVTAPLPLIIQWSEGDSTARINELKHWFEITQNSLWVFNKLGVDLTEMQSGAYKLAIEPIAYFRYGGYDYAMTATEAALYDRAAGGSLTSMLGPLTRQNLPLAIYLENSEFTGTSRIDPWTGSTNSYIANDDIIRQLGIGFIRYPNDHNNGGGLDFEDDINYGNGSLVVGEGEGARSYPTNTYVVTSVRLCNVEPTGNAGSPWTAGKRFALDNPASVTFNINGTYYNVNNIYIPRGGEQLVYVKWRTPTTPRTFDITVTSTQGYFFNESSTDNDNLYCDTLTLTTAITDRNAEAVPPDPRPEHTPATNGYDKTAAENARQSLMNQNQNPASNWTVWDCAYETVYESGETEYSWGVVMGTLFGDEDIINSIGLTVYDEVTETFTTRTQTKPSEIETGPGYTLVTMYFKTYKYAYRFYPINYTVELLQASYEKSAVEPSAHVPTAEQQYGKWTMKSGYGINIKVSSHIKTTVNNTRTGNTTTQTYASAASCSFAANAQTATARFPEFMYATYYRRLEDAGGGAFVFKKNIHSTYNDRSHFTPLWYPDNTDYSVVVTSDRAYTPTGVLKLNSESNAILINGNVYDDWYVAPVKVN